MEHVLCYLSFMSFLYNNALGQTVSLQGSSSSVLLGDSFQLTCTVTGGGSPLQGPLSFQRVAGGTSRLVCVVNSGTCAQFSGDPGYSCGCVTGQTRIFYTNITAVSRNDSSNWRCQYSNNVSNNVSVDVQYAPVITSIPSNKDVTENTSPNIDCSSNITQGNPSTTSYRWTGPGGYSKDGAVLDRPVTRTQGGVYICTASNTAGLSDTAQVNINVQSSTSCRHSARKMADNRGEEKGITLPDHDVFFLASILLLGSGGRMGEMLDRCEIFTIPETLSLTGCPDMIHGVSPILNSSCVTESPTAILTPRDQR